MTSRRFIRSSQVTSHLLVFVLVASELTGIAYLLSPPSPTRTVTLVESGRFRHREPVIDAKIVDPSIYYTEQAALRPEYAARQRAYWASKIEQTEEWQERQDAWFLATSTTAATRASAPTTGTTEPSATTSTGNVQPSIQWRPSVEQWRPLVTKYAGYYRGTQWQIDHLLGIIRCESVGDATAENPSSGTMGLFQHRPQYWNDRSMRAIGYIGDPWDPEVNIAVGVWLYFTGGYGHWEDCGVWSKSQL